MNHAEERSSTAYLADVSQRGAGQNFAQAHALNPLWSGSGRDGTPTTLPLAVVSSIVCEAFRLAGWPFVLAESNLVLDRLGSGAKPPEPPPITNGVSSIHSALPSVELYGTVVEKDLWLVRSAIAIFQTMGVTCLIWACM